MSTPENATNKRRHKKYDEEFKKQAVEMWMKGGKRAEQIAEELGIRYWDLYKWKKKYHPSLPMGGKGSEPPTIEGLQRKLAQMERELVRVKTQREILKKTLGIVSEEPNNDMNGWKR